MRTLLVVMVAACGRISFHELGGGNDDDGGDDAAINDATTTGSSGPRYLIELDANGKAPLIAGSQGAVAVAESFQGSISIAGHAFTGHAMYESSALLWFDATGAPASASVLDSTAVCELRALGNAPTGVLAIGYSDSVTAMPAYGACAIATSRQDGVAIAVDPSGAQTLAGHVVAISQNVQGWHANGFDDGSLAMSGVYGSNGMIGSMPLPMTTSDENPFYARIDPTTGEARWITAVSSTDDIEAGPLDVLGDELCATGTLSGSTSVFGKPLTQAGNASAWVARVSAGGTARFARAFDFSGSTNSISVAALADGGCEVATPAPADVSIDGVTLPASGGPVAVLRFDPSGAAIAGARVPAGFALARLGDTIYGAVSCSAPCAIAGAMYAPVGDDIALVSIDATLAATVIGALANGAVTFDQLSAIPPDALAVSFGAGPKSTTFGALTLAPAGAVAALAVFGIDP